MIEINIPVNVHCIIIDAMKPIYYIGSTYSQVELFIFKDIFQLITFYTII